MRLALGVGVFLLGCVRSIAASSVSLSFSAALEVGSQQLQFTCNDAKPILLDPRVSYLVAEGYSNFFRRRQVGLTSVYFIFNSNVVMFLSCTQRRLKASTMDRLDFHEIAAGAKIRVARASGNLIFAVGWNVRMLHVFLWRIDIQAVKLRHRLSSQDTLRRLSHRGSWTRST